jgi:DNA mismatch repair protein MSH6
MDEQRRRPSDPNYDSSTLYIPEVEWKKLTPGMQRYWEIKKKNFDKVLFYRFGAWFIVYFQDAVICNKFLDLCIPPRQLQKMIGFH